MEAPGELESLRALHQDLVALDEAQLQNIDRLCGEIRAHIQAFKKLLDHPSKHDSSRGKLTSGMTWSRSLYGFFKIC